MKIVKTLHKANYKSLVTRIYQVAFEENSEKLDLENLIKEV